MAVHVSHQGDAVVVTANTAASGVLRRVAQLAGHLARDGEAVVIDVSAVPDATPQQLAGLLGGLPAPDEVGGRLMLVAATPSLWQQTLAVTPRLGVRVAVSVEAAVAALDDTPLRLRGLAGA
jgi:hypothetical protein